jgi:hypothetical protein
MVLPSQSRSASARPSRADVTPTRLGVMCGNCSEALGHRVELIFALVFAPLTVVGYEAQDFLKIVVVF